MTQEHPIHVEIDEDETCLLTVADARLRLSRDARIELALRLLDSPLAGDGPVITTPAPKAEGTRRKPYVPASGEYSIPKPKPPTKTLPPVDPPPEPLLHHRGWRFSRSAQQQVEDAGIDLDLVVDVCENPDEVTASDVPERDSLRGNGLLIVVPENGSRVVIAVARNLPGVASSSMPRAKSGGAGKHRPGTRAELWRVLDAHGFDVDHSGGSHPKLHHRTLNHQPIILPGSASDHRSLENMRSDIRRITGIDIFTDPQEQP